MKKNKLIKQTFLPILAIGLGILAYLVSQNSTTSILRADYKIYESVYDLSKDSDAVIYGKIVQQQPSERRLPKGVSLKNLPPEKAESLGIVTTDFVVKVTDVIQGNPDLIGKTITLRQLGGNEGLKSFNLENSSLSKVNADYLMFLYKTETAYHITGLSQGQYLLQGNKLNSVIEDKDAYPIITTIENLDPKTLKSNYESLTMQSPIKESKVNNSSAKNENSPSLNTDILKLKENLSNQQKTDK